MKFKKIYNITSESVKKGSKKSWDEWVEVLNQAGAKSWTHGEMVKFLKIKFRLSPWWQQWVSIGYQVAVGLRIEGQNAKGLYTMTLTKSLPVEVTKVWRRLISKDSQLLWLKGMYPIVFEAGASFETDDGFFGEIRTLQKNRKMRLKLQDPNWIKSTTLQITLVPKRNGRSLLVLDHSQLPTEQLKEKMRKRWQQSIQDWLGDWAIQ